MYAMHFTRPGISFVVCKLSRYKSKLNTDQWNVVSRILGYLKRTINLELVYFNYPTIQDRHSDVSWITSKSDNKSPRVDFCSWGRYY